jgi:glycosyltransferase involved in cell wall biosynthesis
MARELAHRGHPVCLVTSNVTTHDRALRRTRITTDGRLTLARMGVVHDSPRLSIPLTRMPVSLLRAWRPAILHVCEPELLLGTTCALLARAALRARLVMHCFSDPGHALAAAGPLRALLPPYRLLHAFKRRLSSLLLYLSPEQMALSCRDRASRAKARVLPMCVAPAFRPLPAEAVGRARATLGLRPTDIVYVGRLDPRKGLDVAIRALRHLRGTRLVVIGAGDRRTTARLRALVRGLALDRRVLFPGSLCQAEVSRCLNAAALLVLPSLTPAETFGTVLLEAWACGRPVVTTDVPAPAALVRRAGGGLVASRGDPADLAEKTRNLLESPERAAELGAAGRRWLGDRFSYAAVAARLEELYDGLAADRREG